jgi:hypothetical protein
MVDTLQTGVDKFIALLRKHDKLTFAEVAEKLKVEIDVIQSWVDFLIEENMVGLEYKFTVPYVYLNKKTIDEEVQIETKKLSFQEFKEKFILTQIKGDVPKDKINELWKTHLLEKVEQKKDFFINEALKIGIKDISGAWTQYKDSILDRLVN